MICNNDLYEICTNSAIDLMKSAFCGMLLGNFVQILWLDFML